MDEDVKEEIHSREALCRVCACYTQLLIPIFDGEGLENSIPDKIDKHLPVKVNPSDILPTHICYQCASTIISWHELTTTCVEAEHKLQTLFGNDNAYSSDVQMSPAGIRGDDDADVCADLPPDSSHLDTDGLSSPNLETVTKDHHNEAAVTAKEDVEGEMPKDGEKERCQVKLEGISQKLTCHICDIEFSDTSSLGNHSTSVHGQLQNPLSSGGTLHNCQFCSDTFETEEQKVSHLLVKHHIVSEKGDASVIKPDSSQNCQFCGRFFRHISVLNMHAVSCEKLQGKFDDSDGYCDYVTLDESIDFDVINNKSRGHLGHFKKALAKRGAHTPHGFSDRRDTRVNLKSSGATKVAENSPSEKRPRHKDLKEQRVSCAYCIKSFTRKYDAISHVQKAHRNKLQEFLTWLQRRKFYLKDKLCSICDKTFESTQEATDHMQSCNKDGSENIWTCELCSMKCGNETELLKHIAAHNGSEDVVSLKITPDEIPPSASQNVLATPLILSADNVGSDLNLGTGNYLNINNCAEMLCVGNTVNLGKQDCTDVTSSQLAVISGVGQEPIVVSVANNVIGNAFSTEPHLSKPVCVNDPTHVAIFDANCERLGGTNFLINTLITQEDHGGFNLTSDNSYVNASQSMSVDDLGLPFLVDGTPQSDSTIKINAESFCTQLKSVTGAIENSVNVGFNAKQLCIKGMPVYKCLSCNWLMISKDGLIAHSNRHLNVFKNFCHVCWKHCGNSFKSFMHVRNYHKNHKWYRCHKCLGTFLYRKSVNYHKSLCSQKFKCRICSVICTSRKEASLHKLSHVLHRKVS